jgi:hypothetical protein
VRGRCGSLLLERSQREDVVKSGTHRQSCTGRIIRFYPYILMPGGMGIEPNHSHGIALSRVGGERLNSEPPQMGVVRWLLGRSGGRGDRRAETTAD